MDDIYFDALKLATDELNRRHIDYAVVGGCGNQIWLAKSIAGRRAINRCDESMRPILRPTKDIDIASYQKDEFCEFLFDMSSLTKPSSITRIDVAPYKATVRRNEDRITLQYISETSGMPEDVYRYIVYKAVEVPISKGNVTAHPRVACPEHILTVKLGQQGNREKHYKDVYDMLYNFHRRRMDFDDEEVRSLLKRLEKEDQMNSIARIRQSLK